MEEEGSRVCEAVDTVQYAAVPRKQTAAVLNLQIAFQGRDVYVSDESADAYYQAGQSGLPIVQRS